MPKLEELYPSAQKHMAASATDAYEMACFIKKHFQQFTSKSQAKLSTRIIQELPESIAKIVLCDFLEQKQINLSQSTVHNIWLHANLPNKKLNWKIQLKQQLFCCIKEEEIFLTEQAPARRKG